MQGIENTPQNKQLIANAFSRAANSYDQHAQFQRDVVDQLMSYLPGNIHGMHVLDLGCGTGYVTKQLLKRGANVTCIDISPVMLDIARCSLGSHNVNYICADAENMPVEDNVFDVVISSLVLQWCNDLSMSFNEIKRVMKPHGIGYFTTLLSDSLHELRWAWSQVDEYQHVNMFKSLKRVKLALAQSGIENHQLDLQEIVVWYTSAIALMKDLKGIGATYVDKRRKGLISHRMLYAVEQEYQNFCNSAGLIPATYQVCIGVIRQ